MKKKKEVAKDLKDLTKEQLLKKLKEMGKKHFKSWSKDKLIAAIQEDDEEEKEEDKEGDEKIDYMWYIIPKDYYIFKIDKLEPKMGKKKTNKDKIVGLDAEYCYIDFSMSSQLWYKFNISQIEKYKVCSTEIDNSKSKINYSQIFHDYGGMNWSGSNAALCSCPK